MAKIRKIVYWNEKSKVELVIEYKEVSSRIGVSSRSQFIIQIPEDYNLLISEYETKGEALTFYERRKQIICLSHDTEAGVTNIFNSYFNEFFKLTSKVEKVIVYHFQYQSPNVSSCDDSIDSDRTITELTIDFKVLNKTTLGAATKYRNLEGRLEDIHLDSKIGDYNRYIEIPYSKEAEDFFKGINVSFDNLSKQFLKFTSTAKDIRKAIASQTKFLTI